MLFNRSVLHINAHKVYFCSKSMILYNFIHQNFSLTLFHFRNRKVNFAFLDMVAHKLFHSIMNDNLTIPKFYFYYYSCCCSKNVGMITDFIGQTVYMGEYICRNYYILKIYFGVYIL